MGMTLSQLITDIDERLPNQIPQATKVRWINTEQQHIWKWLAQDDMYSFDTVSTNYLYTLTTDIRLDAISMVEVSNKTTNDGTEEYSKYSFCGADQELADNNWYAGMGEHTIGLYPAPDASGYRVHVMYTPFPADLTTDSLSDDLADLGINEECHEILALKCLESIAKAGNAPDITLANNYDADYKERVRDMKMDYYKRKQKLPRSNWSYKAKWYQG